VLNRQQAADPAIQHARGAATAKMGPEDSLA
jgi:hypothetical protein